MSTSRDDSSRRRFLICATGTLAGGLVVAGNAGCTSSPTIDRQLSFVSLDDALRELDRLAKAPALKLGSVWTWPQTLVHCAQSIEFSLTGFPEMRSSVYQRTIGSAAFSVFSWRGRMTHDLAEPIPSAPALVESGDAVAAVSRLQRAVQEFRSRADSLHPHFAYGELSKAEYERAHAMHLANHFSAFDVQG